MKAHNFYPWNWLRHEEGDNKIGYSPAKYSDDEISPLLGIHKELDRWINRIMTPVGETPLSQLSPSVDIAESENEYVVSVEVPGVEEKDIKINLEDDKLIIEGEKRHQHTSEKNQYHRVERSYGSFSRILSLPKDVRKEDIQASFLNGVLTVRIPRDMEALPNRQEIPIKH
ncbi:Hsp20/alpha crystallin family protein [Vreelandella massiliensis]|uniref:Hsp20/alpha crystallin family protein n=1 Tax=Vreelandella massiliensis TaxID=1816686 RepID=UPI00096ABFFE|nr:Hsp20/alpha crystallin family protein [Halomonas massiliensis]